MPPRLRSGDVLEVEFPRVPSPEVAFPDGGFGYVTYVGKRDDSDVVQVRPGVVYERPPITAALFADSYMTFYPANLALRHKLVTVVGHLPPVAIPPVFRRAGMIDRSGKVLTWLLEDENGIRITEVLTEAESKLDIAMIWNHELLLIRMSQKWKPEWSTDCLGVK